MSGQHCENYDVKRESVHCYPRNVDRCCWNLSALFKICFCFVLLYNKSLNEWALGNSEFCFPRISMFPSTSSRKTLRFSGNKIHCSPRDQSLSVYYIMLYTNMVSACVIFGGSFYFYVSGEYLTSISWVRF